MDFKTKKTAYIKMQGKEFFEADQALLKSIRPNNPFADKKAEADSTKEKLQREILWLLLDMVSIEDIEENRGIEPGKIIPLKTTAHQNLEQIQAKLLEIDNTAPETKEQFNAIMIVLGEIGADIEKLTADEKAILGESYGNVIEKFVAGYAGKLTGLLEKAETIEAAIELLDDIIRLASILPGEACKTIIDFANSVDPFKIKETAILNGKIEELKALDLNDPKIDFKIVSELFDFFNLTSADGQKKGAKVEALKAFLEALPKVIEGTTEETTAPVGEGIQIPTPETKDLEPIKELKNDELKEIVGDLKQENEELNDKVDELSDKIDGLADALDEQKKS